MEQEQHAAAPASVSIGAQLRQARLARGWTVEQVAQRLRLRPALIQALEADDYAPFGAATYARGQLRNYAALLELDAPALLSAFRAPADGQATTPLRRAPELHPRRPRLVRVGGLLVVLASAALAAIWAGAGREPGREPGHELAPRMPASAEAAPPLASAADRRPPAPAPQNPPPAAAPAEVSGAAPGTPAPGAPVAPASTAPASTPGAAPPAQAAAPQAAAPAPVGQGEAQLRLRSRAVSWVEVTDRTGRRLVYELVSPGSERTVHGQPPLRVLLGNAPAVDVFYNDQSVALPPGQHVVRLSLGAPAGESSGAAPSGAAPSAPTP